MFKIKHLLFALILIVTCVTPHKAIAQNYLSLDEKITNFNSKIKINDDGTINVTETISYDFGPNQRHGIFRKIPYVKTNVDGKKYKLEITNINVNNDKFVVSVENENIVIKIGDASTLISGKHTYQVNYKVAGAITYFTDHDELYWNITGNSWEIPINKAQADVTLGKSFEKGEIKTVCFTGINGSSAKDCIYDSYIDSGGNNYSNTFETRSILKPQEGLTIVYGCPKNIVAKLEPKPYLNPNFLFLIFFGIAEIIGFGVIFRILFLAYKENNNLTKKQKIVSAWFDPPKKDSLDFFSPAETSALVNNSANFNVITATIIHLAQQGYLKITADDKNNLTFIKRNEWNKESKINDFEKDILDLIFDNGQKSITTTKEIIKSNKLGIKIPNILNKIQIDLYKNKMYFQDPHKFDVISGIILAIASFITAPFFGWPFAIFAWIVRKKGLPRTDIGIEKYSEAKSLYNFLVSQKDQLNFQAHNQMFFEKLLPYATAFGVEKIWAKRFSDLQFVKNDWYDGPNLNSMALISSFNSFNAGVRAMSSTRSSSGFSSGFSGGSSGGGGGGGGGGSW